MTAVAVEPYDAPTEPVHALADDKARYVAAGWHCIGASTLPDGPTVYWLEEQTDEPADEHAEATS